MYGRDDARFNRGQAMKPTRKHPWNLMGRADCENGAIKAKLRKERAVHTDKPQKGVYDRALGSHGRGRIR